MQPYFLPYIGYWQLIASSDVFVILDDVNYITRGWINRNKFLIHGQPKWLTVPVINSSQNKTIKEIEILDDIKWKKSFLNSIYLSYKQSKYFEFSYQLLENFINKSDGNLSKWIEFTIKEIIKVLKIEVKLISSSNIETKKLSGENRIIEICKIENATSYINLPGGKNLYNKINFSKKNIDLLFLNIETNKNIQNLKFITSPYLSILDLLMNNSINSIVSILRNPIIER